MTARVGGGVSRPGGQAPGRNFIPPPPLRPHFGQKTSFRERGGGVYILKPPAAGFYTPPLFYTPPTPRRVFSGVGGVGVYKIWPRPGVSRPVARGQKFMCCVRNPKNINIFVRTRPGGSMTGVTEKSFMCQMFMAPYKCSKSS